jgi:hypothetical protein
MFRTYLKKKVLREFWSLIFLTNNIHMSSNSWATVFESKLSWDCYFNIGSERVKPRHNIFTPHISSPRTILTLLLPTIQHIPFCKLQTIDIHETCFVLFFLRIKKTNIMQSDIIKMCLLPWFCWVKWNIIVWISNKTRQWYNILLFNICRSSYIIL